MHGLALILPTLALAEPPAHPTLAQPSPLRPAVEVVDAGVEDRGGIEKSFRVLPLDLRGPTGFDQVYRVPGRDDLLMRGSGALFAIFPRGLYRRTAVGTVPVTPTDVVYSIGMPGGFSYPGGFLRDVARSSGPNSSARVDARVRPKPVEPIEGAGAPESASDSESASESESSRMPAIAEAPNAAPARGPAKTVDIRSVADLRLGPPILAHE